MPHHAPSTRLPSSLALAALLAAAYAAPPEARAETPAPAAKALTFDVAAGPLDQVLLGISRQSGLLISFEQSLVRGRQAPAVRGPLSVDQALEQALRGSGLQFRRSERGAVISAAPLRAAVPAAKVQPLAANSASRCTTRCWRPPPAAGTSTGSAVAPRSRPPTTWGWSGAR